jgi:hypothetical protein
MLESFTRFRDRGRCRRLIQQTATSFRFTGLTAAIPLADISFTIGQLDIDRRSLVDAYTSTAVQVDNYQFTLCNTLTNRNLTRNFTPERLAQQTENFIAAQGALAFYSIAFESFIRDPDGQRANFDQSFDLLLDCIRNIVNQAQTQNAEQERRRAISRILSSIGVEGRDQDRVQLVALVTEHHNRVWSRDNLQVQITNEIENLRGRLTDLIAENNLNSQLPNGDNSSIFEIADVLMRHGIIWGEGRGREFAQVITDIENRVVARNERITAEEFDRSDYRLAIPWFELEFQRIQLERRRQQQQQ